MIETTEANNFLDIDIMGSWVEVGMVVTAIVIGVFTGYHLLRGWIKGGRISSPCSPRFRSKHTRVHELLTELRVKVSADRSSILQFHNGGKFLDGSSVKKFSLTHESCSVGVSESMSTRQNLLASAFVDMLDRLSDNKPSIVATSNLPDSNFKRHLESNRTLVFSLMPVKDSRGMLIEGCLLAEWCNWDNADLIDDDKVELYLSEYSRHIESRLSETK